MIVKDDDIGCCSCCHCTLLLLTFNSVMVLVLLLLLLFMSSPLLERLCPLSQGFPHVTGGHDRGLLRKRSEAAVQRGRHGAN